MTGAALAEKEADREVGVLGEEQSAQPGMAVLQLQMQQIENGIKGGGA